MIALILAGVILTESFNYPDGLITNEYAYVNRTAPDRKTSAIWEVPNGSLFASLGRGWTGRPDAVAPNALSSNGTSSSAFRMHTHRSDFGDVEVSVRLINRGFSSNSKYPAVAWDGAHVWLRFVNEYSLYAFSVNRRDNSLVIKKKVPGGPSNGGTYYTLTSGTIPFAVPFGQWQNVKVSARNQADGSVKLELWINGALRASAVDRGTGGPPIRSAGRVGIRGDNADLMFDDFTVSSLDATAATFSGVGSTNVQATTADIVWTTNVPADSQVEYGLTSTFGTLTPLATTKVLKHLVRLTNLKPRTLYYYRVRSNGVVERAVHGFTTKAATSDTTPPVVLSAGSTNVTTSSADVVWTTNEPATSQVEYGLTSTYGTFSTHFTPLLTTHKVKVYGLRPGTRYYYRIRGRDAAGNLRVDSVLHAFTTRS